MGFLNNDEFFLLMDIAAVGDFNPLRYDLKPTKRYNHIPLDDLKKLSDVGVRTTLPFQCIWDEIETAKGVYDWSYFDNYVNNATKAGMKTILFTPTAGYPSWFPDEYFVWCEDGVHREALSPWNDEAQEVYFDFVDRLTKRYSSRNHCMVVSSQLSVGETVLLNVPAFYDPAAVKSFQQFADTDQMPAKGDNQTEVWLRESYIKLIIRQQAFLADTQWREIFVMLHPAIADFGFYGNGNNWIEEILFELKTQLEPVNINHIYYTWIQWSQYWWIMNKWRDQFDEHVFGGAEYAEGLPMTTPAAIQNGLRGQIIAPCYPGIHDKLESWMVENIRTAQNQWLQSKMVQKW